MGNLSDYSGKLMPVIRYEEFSSEALVRLWKATAELNIIHTLAYMEKIKERLGEEASLEIDLEAWRIMTPEHVNKTREAMNITGSDIESILKFFQVERAAGAVFPEFECEIKSSNYGLLKVQRCWGCDYCEAIGDMSLLKYACEVLDGQLIPAAAQVINPKVNVTALKLPPRASKEELACIWEFKLDAEAEG